MSIPESTQSTTVPCATHPKTMTALRCAQCGTPICPRCLVMTPVGAKCASCARARRLPTFVLSPLNVVLAVVGALVGAIALGLVGSIILRIVPLFAMLFPFVAGLALAEIVSRSANRKRHRLLQVIAGLGVVLSYLILAMGDFLVRAPLDLIGSGMLIPMMLNTLVGTVVSPFSLLFLALGVWVAVTRVS